MLPNKFTSKKTLFWLMLGIIVVMVGIFIATLRYIDETTQDVINTSFPTKNVNSANVELNYGNPDEFCGLDDFICIGEKNEVKKVKMYAKTTAYTDYESGGCDDADCIMANGEKAHWGSVACPRKIPLGTNVLIDGQEFTCKDRTAQKVDGRFDLFYGYGKEAHEKALQYGIKSSEIIIL